MAEKFGALLRKLRKTKERSMGEVARHLGVSVPYISDVERGHRPPLTEDRIRAVADFLGVPAVQLLVAAAESRSQFRLDATGLSSMARQVGAALERRWTDLSDEELETISRVLKVRRGED